MANSPPSEIGANLAAAVTFVATDPLGSAARTATPGSFHHPLGHQLFEYGGLMLLSRSQNEGHRLAPAFHPYVDFLNLVSFWPEIASRKARQQSCQAHIPSPGEEAQAIKREAGFKARRWVVERVHSWMNRFRHILIRWDKHPDNYIAFLHFACALIAFRAAGLLARIPHLAQTSDAVNRQLSCFSSRYMNLLAVFQI